MIGADLISSGVGIDVFLGDFCVPGDLRVEGISSTVHRPSSLTADEPDLLFF